MSDTSRIVTNGGGYLAVFTLKDEEDLLGKSMEKVTQ